MAFLTPVRRVKMQIAAVDLLPEAVAKQIATYDVKTVSRKSLARTRWTRWTTYKRRVPPEMEMALYIWCCI
jgi:hypothetical protein